MPTSRIQQFLPINNSNQKYYWVIINNEHIILIINKLINYIHRKNFVIKNLKAKPISNHQTKLTFKIQYQPDYNIVDTLATIIHLQNSKLKGIHPTKLMYKGKFYPINNIVKYIFGVLSEYYYSQQIHQHILNTKYHPQIVNDINTRHRLIITTNQQTRKLAKRYTKDKHNKTQIKHAYEYFLAYNTVYYFLQTNQLAHRTMPRAKFKDIQEIAKQYKITNKYITKMKQKYYDNIYNWILEDY